MTSRSLSRLRRAAPALAAVALLALSACETTPAERSRAVDMANSSRAAVGRSALIHHGDLGASAEAAAVRMRDSWVAAGCPKPTAHLVHTSNLEAHYRPARVTASWAKVGENIGYIGLSGGNRTAAIEGLHRAYMASPTHRDNILDAGFRHVGIGTASGPTAAQSAAGACPGTRVDSVLWNAQVFVK